MKQLLTVILLLLPFSNARAEYKAGINIDSSSNMLMQPESESGTFIRLNGAFGKSILNEVYISYETDYAFLQHYNGLQFHNHELSSDYSLISNESFTWNSAVSGNFARFGDVTVLDGYNSYSLISAIKYYIRPTVLLRWGFLFDNKNFLKYDSENFNEAEIYMRVDKFFKTRTTVRFEVNSGIRSYIKLQDKPVSKMSDVRILIAQSFTDITGGNIEIYASSLTSGISSTDSSLIFNRVFLDDKYKYTRTGISLSLTRLIPGKGSMKVNGTYTDRGYDKNSIGFFDYLPQNGWTEKEKGLSFTLIYNAGFLPDYIHPSCRLYYLDINASESFLSYNSAGLSVNLSIY